MFGITVYNIGNSFALFESDFTIDAGSTAGSWNILVNNVDITGSSGTFTVNNVNVTGNNHVVANKMAPGTSAYFDINIVPTGTDVSLDFIATLKLFLLKASTCFKLFVLFVVFKVFDSLFLKRSSAVIFPLM